MGLSGEKPNTGQGNHMDLYQSQRIFPSTSCIFHSLKTTYEKESREALVLSECSVSDMSGRDSTRLMQEVWAGSIKS